MHGFIISCVCFFSAVANATPLYHSSSKQRRATRKEVRELEELVESELKDARTTLNIQVHSSSLSC